MSGSADLEDDLFQEAVAAYEAGRYNEARELFRRVVELNGDRRSEAQRYLALSDAPIRLRREWGKDRQEGGTREPKDPRHGPIETQQLTDPIMDPPPAPKPPIYGGPAGRDDSEVSLARGASFTPLKPNQECIEVSPCILRRTPHLDVPPLKDRFQIRVYTDSGPLRDGEEGEEVVVEGPPEQTRFDVDVWLVAGAPFKVEGPPLRTLTILRDQDRSDFVKFTVFRQRSLEGIEKVSFSALFSYQGRACGRVTRIVSLAKGGPCEIDAEEPAGLRIEADTEGPDLSVRIVRGDDDCRFHCVVQTIDRTETGDWRLSSRAADVVREQMARFMAKGVSGRVRTMYLRSAGFQLFEASPPVFQRLFWELIDSGKPPKTISILTEEPYLPWELMVPTRTLLDGETEERQPLGVEFLISRWTSKNHIAPPQRVPLRDSWVVAPRDSRLMMAEDEAAMVLKEIPGERIDPAGIEKMEEILGRQGRSLLHFVCHGKSGAAGSQILFLEKREEFEAGLLRDMPGVKKAFKSGKPLVFLNACEVGRKEPALVGVGGFAEQFMALGASGVIAPLWSVKDSLAHQLAVEFYRRLQDEPETPFSQILRDLRGRSYAEGGGEDTWAAYCFYGDPLARRA